MFYSPLFWTTLYITVYLFDWASESLTPYPTHFTSFRGVVYV